MAMAKSESDAASGASGSSIADVVSAALTDGRERKRRVGEIKLFLPQRLTGTAGAL